MNKTLKFVVFFACIVVFFSPNFTWSNEFPSTHPPGAVWKEFRVSGDESYKVFVWEQNGLLFAEFVPSSPGLHVCDFPDIVQGGEQYTHTYIYKEDGRWLCEDLYVPLVGEIFIGFHTNAGEILDLSRPFSLYFQNTDEPFQIPVLIPVDTDGDGIPDISDNCPNDANNDIDSDGICGDIDNCPDDANPDQTDSDSNGIGDACKVKAMPLLMLLLSND